MSFYRRKEFRETLVKIKIGGTLLDTFRLDVFPNLEEVVVIKDDNLPYYPKFCLKIFPTTLKSITCTYMLHDNDCDVEKPYENLTVIKSIFSFTVLKLLPNLRVIYTSCSVNILFLFKEIEDQCKYIEEIVVEDKWSSTLDTGCITHTLLRKLKVFSIYTENTETCMNSLLPNCTNMQDLICCRCDLSVVMRRTKGMNIRLLDNHFVEIKPMRDNSSHRSTGNYLVYYSSKYEKLDPSLVSNVTRIEITTCTVEDVEGFIKAFKNLRRGFVKIRNSDRQRLENAITKYNPNLLIIAMRPDKKDITSQVVRFSSNLYSINC